MRDPVTDNTMHRSEANAGPDRAEVTAKGDKPILHVEDLKKHFIVSKGFPRSVKTAVRAVDGVTLAVHPGEAFGLVGESGCGKSTAARAILRLIEPDSGTIQFGGEDFRAARGAKLNALRRRMQIVFQDPYSSLNPRHTIGQTLMEPLVVHGLAHGRGAREMAIALLDEVGLSQDAMDHFPHQFSGGQRQRIGIARALTLRPDVIIADEPVSALDVSVQAQILILLKRLQQERKLAFIFVSHDLGVIRWFCDRVGVMYLGRVVEEGAVEDVMTAPRHPYSLMLAAASPVPEPVADREFAEVVGEMPSPVSPPSGCHFHPRCPRASEICRRAYPPWTQTDGRGFACHHPSGA